MQMREKVKWISGGERTASAKNLRQEYAWNVQVAVIKMTCSKHREMQWERRSGGARGSDSMRSYKGGSVSNLAFILSESSQA